MSATATAADYFVDATAGSDAPGARGTATQPFRTIARALEVALLSPPPTNIFLRANAPHQGFQTVLTPPDVTLTSVPGGPRATIRGVAVGAALPIIALVNAADGWTMRNLRIDDVGADPSSSRVGVAIAGTGRSSRRIVLEDCEFDIPHAPSILLRDAEEVDIRRNRLVRGDFVISGTGRIVGVRVVDNEIQAANGAAIYFGPDSATVTVRPEFSNVAILRNRMAVIRGTNLTTPATLFGVGVFLAGAQDVLIANNLIVDFAGAGITLGATTGINPGVARVRVVHNTLSATAAGPASLPAAGLALFAVSDLDFSNNLLQRGGPATAAVISASVLRAGVIRSRNNIFSGTASALPFVYVPEMPASSPIATFAQWQSQMRDTTSALLTDGTALFDARFHLVAGSRAIDFGDPSVISGDPRLAADVDGDLRDPRPDVGADEFRAPVVIDGGVQDAAPDGEPTDGDPPDGAPVDDAPQPADDVGPTVNVRGGACQCAAVGVRARASCSGLLALVVALAVSLARRPRRSRRRLCP